MNLEIAAKCPHISDTGRTVEQRLEELPAVLWCPHEIHSKLTEYTALFSVSDIRHQCAAQFPPARDRADIDDTSNAAVPQGKYSLGCFRLYFT